jgi:hypothetical protein
MAAYRNVGLVNSPNTNNNNNNNHHHHQVSSTLNRDGYDYSSTKYNQQPSYKSLKMPKSHYQQPPPPPPPTTTDNGTNYSTASSSFDTESNSNMNEPSKRINNPNGKFSIQKMIRQGFSSWRTRKKPSSASTPPPSLNTIYTNNPSPPPPPQSPLLTGRYMTNNDDLSQIPPSTTGRYMSNNDDLSQIPPPTAARSISVDSISNNTSPQRIIVTEAVTFSSARANSVDSVTVDFDRPPTAARTYIQSPWTNSSTSTATTITTTTTPVTTESIPRPTPVPITRILPVQFTENNKMPAPRSPLQPSSLVSPPPRSPIVQKTTTTKPIETNNSTSPLTSTTTNASRIPPPGKILSFENLLIKSFFLSFSCS